LNSSRFIARPTARLHARSVPPVEDHGRCIAVRVVSVPARGAAEARLVLSTSAVHGSTRAAGLRGIAGIDLDQFPRLVGEHGLDLVPPDIEDSSVETAFLRDVAARGLDGSRRARRHVLGAQTLDDDGSVSAANIRCRGVRPMLADAGLPCLELGDAAIGLGVADGAALASTDDALSLADSHADQIDRRWQAVACAIGQHQRDGHAAINSDIAGNYGNVVSQLAADAELPAECGADDRGLSDATLQRPRVAELHPADFWQADARPAAIELFDADLAAGERKGIVDALALELRIPTKTFPCPAKRFVQRLQSPLLWRDVNGADKIDLGAEICQLPGLRHVIEIVAGRGLKVAPVVQTLIKREVPHQATNARELIEQNSLFDSRA